MVFHRYPTIVTLSLEQFTIKMQRGFVGEDEAGKEGEADIVSYIDGA